ncbi:NDP-sugar synthase [Acidobacteria bacterium AH-259-G07]|nr:NDP-sugar synthase [Acidobacteria bacterium AH-259-G07]
MKAMILAAGLGTRLYPLTAFRPKPAVPFLNRPFIHYSLELLQRAHVQDIVVNLHHLPNSITEAVEAMKTEDQAPPQIVFSHEDKILGTAGAIGKVRDFLAGDTFVVCNGKIYFEEDLQRAICFHHERESIVTLLLVPYSEGDSYGSVFMDKENNITRFGSRKQKINSDLPYVFTGVHILEPEIFDFIPDAPSDTVKDLYPRLIEEGHSVRGFVSQADWCECSTPQRYLSKSLEVLKRKGLENLIEAETRLPYRGVVASLSVELNTTSFLENSILWDRVRVGQNSSLCNVIIADGVELAPETHLRNAIVTPLRGTTEEKLAAGAWVKENYLIWPL